MEKGGNPPKLSGVAKRGCTSVAPYDGLHNVVWSVVRDFELSVRWRAGA